MRTLTTVLTTCCLVLPLTTASAEALPTSVNRPAPSADDDCDLRRPLPGHHPHNTWIEQLMQNLMRALGACHA